MENNRIGLKDNKIPKKNKKQLTVTFESWDYDCSDGCCTWFGTSLYLNNKKLPHPDKDGSGDYVGDDIEISLRAVLKELGYNVKIEHR